MEGLTKHDWENIKDSVIMAFTVTLKMYSSPKLKKEITVVKNKLVDKIKYEMKTRGYS